MRVQCPGTGARGPSGKFGHPDTEPRVLPKVFVDFCPRIMDVTLKDIHGILYRDLHNIPSTSDHSRNAQPRHPADQLFLLIVIFPQAPFVEKSKAERQVIATITISFAQVALESQADFVMSQNNRQVAIAFKVRLLGLGQASMWKSLNSSLSLCIADN